MPVRPWYEVEQILRGRGASGDDIFATKNRYFDFVMSRTGLEPDDEEVEKRKKLFLYGNEKEWELLKAAKSGLIRGFGEIPETAADVINFGQQFIPGESERANEIEASLREKAQDVRELAGEFQPSSAPERIVSGVAHAPGVAVSMAPFAAGAAAAGGAIAATAPVSVPGALIGGALGFGGYEAIRRSRETPLEQLKGFGKGAALGAVLQGAGSLTKGVTGALKGRAARMGAAGAGTAAVELATGADLQEAAETGATFALLSGMHRSVYEKVKDRLAKQGITDEDVVRQETQAELQMAEESQSLALASRKKESPPTRRAEKIYNLIFNSGVASDHIASLYAKDPVNAIATDFDLNTVTMRDIRGVREIVKRNSSEALKRKGFEGDIKVYRGGEFAALGEGLGDNTIVSVTSDPAVAKFFAKRTGFPDVLKEFVIHTDDVIGYSEITPGTFFEGEIQLKFGDLRKPGEPRRKATQIDELPSSVKPVRASEFSKASGLSKETLTGNTEFFKRFRRTTKEVPPNKTRPWWNYQMRAKMIQLAKEKEAAKEEPGAVDEAGNTTDRFNQFWDNEFASVAKEFKTRIQGLPSQPVGATWTLFDNDGKTPIFEAQRISWKKGDPVQYEVRKLSEFIDAAGKRTTIVDDTAPRKHFANLSEVTGYLKEVVNDDPVTTLGAMFTQGSVMMDRGKSIGDTKLWSLGRQIKHTAAKQLGFNKVAEATRPLRADEVADGIQNVLQENILGDPGLDVAGRYNPNYAGMIVRSKNDLGTIFHETGHAFKRYLLRHLMGEKEPTPEEYGKVADPEGFLMKNAFTLEERLMLDALGREAYTTRDINNQKQLIEPSGTSYEAEGVAEFFRGKFKQHELPPEWKDPSQEGGTAIGNNLALKMEKYIDEAGFRDKVNGISEVYHKFLQQTPEEKIRALNNDRTQSFVDRPLAYLGERFYNMLISSGAKANQEQKAVWAKRHPERELPQSLDLANLAQNLPGSAVAQMARGTVTTGRFPNFRNLTKQLADGTTIELPETPIQIEPLQSIMVRAGFRDPKMSKAEADRAMTDYSNAQALAAVHDAIDMYELSRSPKNRASVPPEMYRKRGYNKFFTQGELFAAAKDQEKRKSIIAEMGGDMSKRDALGRTEMQALRDALEERYPKGELYLDWLYELYVAKESLKSDRDAGGFSFATPEMIKARHAGFKLGKDDSVSSEDVVNALKNYRKFAAEQKAKGISPRNMVKTGSKWRAEHNIFLPLLQEKLDYIVGKRKLQSTYIDSIRADQKILSAETAIIKSLEDTFAEVAHNRYFNAMLDTTIKDQAYAGKMIAGLRKDSEIKPQILKGDIDPTASDEGLVSFRRGSKKLWLQFNLSTPEGVGVWRSVRRTGPLLMGHKFIDTIVGGPKRMMVLGTTGANLGFLIVANPPRDVFTSAIQSALPERTGWNGVFRTLKDTIPFLINTNLDLLRKGESKALADLAPAERAKTESLLRYASSGVKGSTLVGEDFRGRKAFEDQIRSRADKLLPESEAKSLKVYRKYGLTAHFFRHPIEALRAIAAVSEDLSRFPEFYRTELQLGQKYYDSLPSSIERVKAELSQIDPNENPVKYREFVETLSKMEADLQAGPQPRSGPLATRRGAEVTIDFKRAGVASRWINELVPFFNPSLQGSDKFVRTLFSDKTPSLKNLNRHALAKAAEIVTIPTIGLWALNKDEEWYKELPRWEKLLFWHAKIGDTVMRLPVPFEWGIMLGTLPVMIYDNIYNDSPEYIKEAMGQALKTIVPYDAITDVQVVKPLWEAKANVNTFTGIPIESKAMERQLPQSRYREDTLGIYKGVGQAASKLNEALWTPEALQSPVMVEHLVRGYFGSAVHGLLSDLHGQAKSGLILGRLISNTKRPGQSVQDFYNALDKADQSWGTAKKLIAEGDKNAAMKVLLSHRKYLGLTPAEIRQIVQQRDPQTPQRLLEMHRASNSMAEARKKKNSEEMTEIAQAILGRDWD